MRCLRWAHQSSTNKRAAQPQRAGAVHLTQASALWCYGPRARNMNVCMYAAGQPVGEPVSPSSTIPYFLEPPEAEEPTLDHVDSDTRAGTATAWTQSALLFSPIHATIRPTTRSTPPTTPQSHPPPCFATSRQTGCPDGTNNRFSMEVLRTTHQRPRVGPDVDRACFPSCPPGQIICLIWVLKQVWDNRPVVNAGKEDVRWRPTLSWS